MPVHTVEGVEGPESNALAAESPAESLSDATVEAYGRDFTAFAAWCRARDLTSMPADPETVMTYLVEALRSGRRPRGVTRVATAINTISKRGGHPPPWPSSSALKAELQRRVPEAFDDEDSEDIRTWQEEREAVVDWFEWLGTQIPPWKPFFGQLRQFVVDGHHLEPPSETVAYRFWNVRDRGETVCRFCGCAVVAGRLATTAEQIAHRCTT